MPLESALTDISNPEKRLSSEQLISLSDLNAEEVTQFRETWDELGPGRRKGLLSDLRGLAEDNVELSFDALFEIALLDDDESIRSSGLQGLHENERPRLATKYMEMLRSDPSPEVRREAAIALGRYAIAAALDQLEETLGQQLKAVLFKSAEDLEEDELVRARAIESAGAFGGEDTENLIESIYREEESLWLRVGAVDAMGRTAEELWVPLLCQEMDNLAPEMRHAAAYAAGEIGDEEAIEPLKVLAIADPDKEVQRTAVQALGEISGDRAKIALKAILYEGDDELADSIQEALQRIDFDQNPLGLSG